MLNKIITIFILFSFVSSFASEVGINFELDTSFQTAAKCYCEPLSKDLSLNKSNNTESRDQGSNNECCDSFCLCACNVVINLPKIENYISQSPLDDTSLRHDFQRFYKSPFIEPALKPPLFS
jgi:hypothetical protein